MTSRQSKPSRQPNRGWKEILISTRDKIGRDNLSIVAAGVAFYMLLSVFPAIGALVAIYGIVADPAHIQQLSDAMGRVAPEQAMDILETQLSRVATSGQSGALGFGALFGIVLAVWSAARGIKAVIIGLNIVYSIEERRGFIKLNAVALMLTFGAILFGIVSLGFIVAIPILLNLLGLPSPISMGITLLRWPLLAAFVVIGVALLYRYAPNRDRPEFRWISWGSAVSTLLWIAASALFSFYVSHFGSFNETYGSIGAVIILLMWFYITAFVILLGAELDAQMQHFASRSDYD